ncbi:MAG: hypothetical protein ACYDDE_00290 [bacterium]
MKLIIDEPKAVALDDSYSKRESNSDSDTLIPDNFYESKSASIFDDDFQGIEWPKKEKQNSIMMIDSNYMRDSDYMSDSNYFLKLW